MSFRFLCEDFSWSRQIFLPLNDLIKASLENKDFRHQLDSFITFSIRSIRKEMVNKESLQSINSFVSLLEEFIFNLNELHTSSEKALPDFDDKITPLIYKYAELVVVQSRLTDSQKEYEMRLVRYLNSLSINSTLNITPCHRTAAFLTRLLSDEVEEIPDIPISEDSKKENLVINVNPPKLSLNKENVGSCENVVLENEDIKTAEVNVVLEDEEIKAAEVNVEPSVIPETPLKSSPTCVGVAAIRGIIPISSGSLFPLTPPITESTDVCLSVKPQVENLANFPTPSHTPPLIELQKGLRERFPTPFVTPTEKKTRRDVMRTIRSNRRPQISPWNVVETRSPARSCNLRKQLFIDTDSRPNSSNSSSSQLALYLSPDTEKDTSKSVSPDCPSPKKSPGKSSASENFKTQSPVQEKNEESYTELKKSIEGNLMGCEASLSDVELMDEIESSINLNNDVIFIDPTSKADNRARIEYILPESVSPIFQDVKLGESSEASDHFTTKKTLSRSSQEERRRSSRLAGIPLPLKFSTEPLPDCRRINSSKKITLKQLKEKEALSSPKDLRTESANDLPIQPIQRETIEESTSSQLFTASWQQFRLQIPTCWADLIENHIKENHPDEMLRLQEESGARWPTIYCNCAQAQAKQD